MAKIFGQLERAQAENVSVDPSGSQLTPEGRLFYQTTSNRLMTTDGTTLQTIAIAGTIANAEVQAGAAISVNKLAAMTANRAAITDGSGFLTISSATDTEVGYLSGVTSSIQTQINNVNSTTKDPALVGNVSISTSFGVNSLIVSFVAQDGTALSAVNTAAINFRNVSKPSGTFLTRTIAAAGPSITIPDGATFGHSNLVEGKIYVYAIDVSGVVEIAVSGADFSTLDGIVTTIAISATSTDNNFLYSTTARTSVPCKLIGTMTSLQIIAGDWDAPPTLIEDSGTNQVGSTANLIGLRMGTSGANAIGTAMTSGGANAIATSITTTGADAIAADMSSTGANSIIDDYTRTTGTSVNVRGVAISAASGNFFTSSTTFVDVPNLSVTITTSGRPVMLMIQSAGTAGEGSFAAIGNTVSFSARIKYVRDSTDLAHYVLQRLDTGLATDREVRVPLGAFSYVDAVAAGTYVYKVQLRCTDDGAEIFDGKLVAYEL